MNKRSSAKERSVFVGNIPYDVTEEQLKDIFSGAGTVVNFRLVTDRETGKPKGYGFCEYADGATAMSAMRNLNGYEVSGRNLRVDFADGGNDKSSASSNNTTTTSSSSGGFGNPTGRGYDDSSNRSTPAVSGEAILKAIEGAISRCGPLKLFDMLVALKEHAIHKPEHTQAMLTANPALTHAIIQSFKTLQIPIPTPSEMPPQHAMPQVHGPPQVPLYGRPTMLMPPPPPPPQHAHQRPAVGPPPPPPGGGGGAGILGLAPPLLTPGGAAAKPSSTATRWSSRPPGVPPGPPGAGGLLPPPPPPPAASSSYQGLVPPPPPPMMMMHQQQHQQTAAAAVQAPMQQQAQAQAQAPVSVNRDPRRARDPRLAKRPLVTEPVGAAAAAPAVEVKRLRSDDQSQRQQPGTTDAIAELARGMTPQKLNLLPPNERQMLVMYMQQHGMPFTN